MLASALLGTSLGLSAGLARTGGFAIVLLALSASVIAALSRGATPAEGVIDLAWFAIAATGVTIWLPVRIRNIAILVALGCISGTLAGTLPGASRVAAVMLFAVCLVLAAAASAILFARGWILPARVAASWLIAIAALNFALTLLPVTPGYLPDHLE